MIYADLVKILTKDLNWKKNNQELYNHAIAIAIQSLQEKQEKQDECRKDFRQHQ